VGVIEVSPCPAPFSVLGRDAEPSIPRGQSAAESSWQAQEQELDLWPRSESRPRRSSPLRRNELRPGVPQDRGQDSLAFKEIGPREGRWKTGQERNRFGSSVVGGQSKKGNVTVVRRTTKRMTGGAAHFPSLNCLCSLVLLPIVSIVAVVVAMWPRQMPRSIADRGIRSIRDIDQHPGSTRSGSVAGAVDGIVNQSVVVADI
jgi:hypothetical protein